MERISKEVVLVSSANGWGFDVWYAEVAPVVVAWQEGRVTVGVRDQETARQLFGPEGLGAVYCKLEPPGWGGRPSVGGSPRGGQLDFATARAAAAAIAAAVGPPVNDLP